jgi:drug/metabolite transporter (DMT)-like permease
MSWRAFGALALAVVAISWGAPLARLADAAPLAVAMWRMSLAAAILLPVALLGRADWSAIRLHWKPVALAGGFLGLHFALWIPSLWLTSVSASVVLVTTSPLWILLLTPYFLGSAIRSRNLVSFAMAFAGVALISWGDFRVSPRALIGDAMALGGALAAASYMVIGKRLRQTVALQSYLAAVYSGAALTLVAAVGFLRVAPMPRTSVSWLALLGLALGPTLVGHTMLNWSLAHLEAYKVNLAVLLEPVGASLLTWLVIGEAPPLHVLPGGILVLAALTLEYLPGSGSAPRPAGGS